MESTGKETAAFKCPKIGDFFHHAQQALVAARVAADRTGIGGVEIAARRTGAEVRGNLLERGKQRFERAFAFFHQMEHGAPRRTRAKPG